MEDLDLKNNSNDEINVQLTNDCSYKEMLKKFSKVCLVLFVVFSICATSTIVFFDWFFGLVVGTVCLMICGFIYCSILRNSVNSDEFQVVKNYNRKFTMKDDGRK